MLATDPEALATRAHMTELLMSQRMGKRGAGAPANIGSSKHG